MLAGNRHKPLKLQAGGRRAVLPSQQLEDQTDTELPSWCEDEDMSDGPQATNSEDTDSEMEQQVLWTTAINQRETFQGLQYVEYMILGYANEAGDEI